MANTRALKARIRSAESIRQMTKSMKMVSASKLRRTQLAMSRLAPMAEGSRKLMGQLLTASGQPECPLIERRTERLRVCYVLLVGNRGLCGVYNSALAKYFQEITEREEREHFAVICGRWGQDVIEPSGVEVRRRFAEFGDVPEKAEADRLSDYLTELYISGQADEIVFVYQRYDSFLKQTPCTKTLLPVTPEGDAAPAEDYIFEPDRASLMESLSELYVRSSVLELMLEARTGEHAARMASMTSASDNTDELIGRLTLALNHARQAAITTEISEIAGGAEALNSAGKQPGAGGRK